MEVDLDDGTISQDHTAVLNKWKNDYKRLLNPEKSCSDQPPELAPKSFINCPTGDLDKDIQRAEIVAAIHRAKKGKAVGPDDIPVEALCNDRAVDFLYTLFVKCYDSGTIPSAWQYGTIVPIPKPGCKDNREPLNYRGITLASAVYKLYCTVLENRLRTWLESNNAIDDEQNGFRKDRNCIDHLSVITSIIENRKMCRKGTFISFVDFSKAYDRVDRGMLWTKLEAYGLEGKIMKALKSIYECVKCNVRINGMHTDWFDVGVGLKQGCSLSPILFNMYINDLCKAIKATGKGVKVGDECVSILLFADDLVLMAENEADLQYFMNVLSDWCSKWGVAINTEKTNIVHFRPKGQPRSNVVFRCGNEVIAYKDRYRYLGLWLTEHLEYDCMAKEVAKAAHRALGLIIAKSKAYGGMPFDSFTLLYNACVLPVITYGAGIWGQKQYACIDAVHNRVCRYYLGVNKSAPNSAVQGDMGWKLPIQQQWMSVSRLWLRLCQMSTSRLSKKVFLWAHNMYQSNRKQNWVHRCVKYYKEIEMDHLTHIEWDFTVSDVLKDIDLVLFELHEQNWYADVNRDNAIRGDGGNKLRTYKQFKGEFVPEAYVKQIMPFPFRSALAKIRCGVAPIRIETGRYGSRRIPVEERVCMNCVNEIEDEFHVLMKCELYDDLRMELVEKAYQILPEFAMISEREKFNVLLSNEKIVYFTAKTLSNILRRHKAFYQSVPKC